MNELKNSFDYSNMKFEYKDVKDRLFTGIPLVTYGILFIFSILFQIVDINFEFKLMLSGTFWVKLLIKYFTILLVFFLLYPFFSRLLSNSDEAKKIKNKAKDISEKIVFQRLSVKLKEYTKIEMDKEEKMFYLELLSSCGNIPEFYLNSEYTMKKIGEDFKEQKLNKQQYKLLKNIKYGKIKFAKLKGDEIKFVCAEKSLKNKIYSNQGNEIIINEIIIKILAIAILGILSDLVLNSFFGQDFNIKEDWIKAIMSIVTTLLNYATSMFFAFTVANKVINENLRFTEVVTIHVTNFLEDVETGKYKCENKLIENQQ